MTCPKPEVLSQWIDGALDAPESAAVESHAKSCSACGEKARELVAVAERLASAVEPGPSCVSVDDMASALESGRVPAHVRTCPRCAAEFRALKPEKETKRATRRRERPEAPARSWAVAAAIFIAVGILLVLAVRQTPTASPEWAYRPPTPVNPHVSEPMPVVPVAPKPPVTPPPVVVKEQPSLPSTTQKENPARVTPPAPVVEQPVAPEITPPPVRETVKETVAETARAVAALGLRSGALSALTTQGKWVKPERFEEGMTLRAEQRTQVDFAQAKVTLDRDSRFSVSKDEFALLEGTLSAEVSTGGHFVLVLNDQRFFPQTQNARVLLCAKPDRLFLEEGSAKWRDTVLGEGSEYGVKKDSVEARKGRPFATSRTRETLTWRMDLSNLNTVKKNVVGRIDKDSPEGRMLVSEPSNGGIFYGTVIYNNGGEAAPVFTVKPNTAIRIHYYLREPAYLELVMWNGTKGENFNRTLEPAVRQWTTMTVYARDVAANRGGKPVTCEVGDKYTSVGLFVGKAGMPSEVYIDRLEILEIDR
jgi:hypothetical protein